MTDALRAQAEKFGFGDDSYLDELHQVASRSRPRSTSRRPPSPRSASSRSSATPLQMAMVAAGIANDGTVMKPYLVDKIYSPDLELLEEHDREELHQAVSSGVAAQLTQMMVAVASAGGTGRSIQIPGVTSRPRPAPPSAARSCRRTRGSCRSRLPTTHRWRSRCSSRTPTCARERDLRGRPGGPDRQGGHGVGDRAVTRASRRRKREDAMTTQPPGGLRRVGRRRQGARRALRGRAR